MCVRERERQNESERKEGGWYKRKVCAREQETCITLQHTATHCTALQYTATGYAGANGIAHHIALYHPTISLYYITLLYHSAISHYMGQEHRASYPATCYYYITLQGLTASRIISRVAISLRLVRSAFRLARIARSYLVKNVAVWDGHER